MMRIIVVVALLLVALLGCNGSDWRGDPDSLVDPWEFKELSSQEVTKLEYAVGSTPPLPLVVVPPPPKHPDIDGTPGPSAGMGPNEAHARIYVWSDFQCPNCRRAVEPLKYLVRKYRGDVQVVFKQMPLRLHSKARPAAIATMAALKQGKFWEYHDMLFDNMGNLEPADLLLYAERLGLDMGAFKADLNNPEVAAWVDYDANLAAKLGVSGTPAFHVLGTKQMGWGSLSMLERKVNEALKMPSLPDDMLCLVDEYPCAG